MGSVYFGTYSWKPTQKSKFFLPQLGCVPLHRSNRLISHSGCPAALRPLELDDVVVHPLILSSLVVGHLPYICSVKLSRVVSSLYNLIILPVEQKSPIQKLFLTPYSPFLICYLLLLEHVKF